MPVWFVILIFQSPISSAFNKTKKSIKININEGTAEEINNIVPVWSRCCRRQRVLRRAVNKNGVSWGINLKRGGAGIRLENVISFSSTSFLNTFVSRYFFNFFSEGFFNQGVCMLSDIFNINKSWIFIHLWKKKNWNKRMSPTCGKGMGKNPSAKTGEVSEKKGGRGRAKRRRIIRQGRDAIVRPNTHQQL